MSQNPVVAGVLAAVVPGLGHAYAGRPLRGLSWLAAPVVGLVACGFGPFASAGSALGAFVVVITIAYVGSVVDAVLVARRARSSTEKTPAVTIAVFAALGMIVLPIVVAMGTRALLVEAFKVPSGAMIPSVAVGDHFFVDKLVYRKRTPRRGEVAVFRYPEHPDQSFVKRVIGLPGDKIEARGGHPLINGWEVPSCRVGPYSYRESFDGSGHKGELFVEFLGDEAYFVLFDESPFAADYQGPFRFEEWFVMGDNRNNSHDSRMWNGGAGGGVPAEKFQGRARWLWMPRLGDLAGPLVAPTPALAEPLARCLKERPPREKTTPPPKG